MAHAGTGVLTPVTLSPRRRAPSADGDLVDTFGRIHTSLRISVTDRCNLRCRYCMPEDGMDWLPERELLRVDEIVRIATVSRGLGIRAVRLTGGEPLARRELEAIVEGLARVGFDDLALTTNGVGLARRAEALAASGLRRVNVSCDSLRRDRYRTITRRDALHAVIRGMDAAERAGLSPIKVNVVVQAGVNDDEIGDFVDFARHTGRTVRFLEVMPLDADRSWAMDRVVSGEEILRRADAAHDLVAAGDERGVAPAERFAFADGTPGEVGVIRSVTQPFCAACDRLRVTADGMVRNCLFGDREWSLRERLRAGAGDAEIEHLLRAAVWAKAEGHGIGAADFRPPDRPMSQIGG